MTTTTTPDSCHVSYTPKTLHVAPMLDCTTREHRALMRILSKRLVLWSEMVVDSTILFAEDLDFHLDYDRDRSHPIICQIGGNNPEWIYRATKRVIEYGYDEVNLNMGCPSNRVEGLRKFGALLMKEVQVAEKAVRAMMEASNDSSVRGEGAQRQNAQSCSATPISVKCRVGVDDNDTLDDLVALVRRLSQQGCTIFYLHARKAVLGGLLSPAQNRYVPPLNYPRVYAICNLFPDCDFYINGGIKSLKDAKEVCYGLGQEHDDDHDGDHGSVPCAACMFDNGSCVAPLRTVAPVNLRGCLMGRAATDNPCIFWDVDRYFYGEANNPCQTRREILLKYCSYLECVYPRRCCDQDIRVTSKITDPVNFEFEYDYCSKCAPLYVSRKGEVENDHGRCSTDGDFSVAPPDYGKAHGKKITSHVMNRSFKPINNVFFGLPKTTLFRQEGHRLVRNDCVYRNCGPGALIRRALLVMPPELLDQELAPAEEQKTTYM
jgi:tRNA-dihydrouridine synthase A